MSGRFRLLFLFPSPLPNDPERKFLTLDLTSRRLLPWRWWLPVDSSESLEVVTEAVLSTVFEAATRVLVVDDSSSGQDCFGVSAPEEVLKSFQEMMLLPSQATSVTNCVLQLS